MFDNRPTRHNEHHNNVIQNMGKNTNEIWGSLLWKSQVTNDSDSEEVNSLDFLPLFMFLYITLVCVLIFSPKIWFWNAFLYYIPFSVLFHNCSPYSFLLFQVRVWRMFIWKLSHQKQWLVQFHSAKFACYGVCIFAKMLIRPEVLL